MFKAFFISLMMLLSASLGVAQEQKPEKDAHQAAPNAPAVEKGKYWLGIWCSDVAEPLRKQLNLPEKEGVLVLGVAPDSPAAKSGIAPYDVLLRAGGKTLTEPADLVQAIETTGEGKMAIDVVHQGKTVTIETQPVLRPEAVGSAGPASPFDRDWKTMERWLHGVLPEVPPGMTRPPLRFHVIHPGAILPRDAVVSAPLPENMKIVISKEADQPAKISVRRGEETWEVTEKELDKLPSDVRTHVERMLGFGSLGILSGVEPEAAAPAPAPNGWEGRLEKRMDDMDRRMERMLQAIEHPESKGAKE